MKQRPPETEKAGRCVHCGLGRATVHYAVQGSQTLWIHAKCKELRKTISLSQIEIDPTLNLRIKSSPEALESLQDLIDSIKKIGLDSPLIVTQGTRRGMYKLVSGFRRYEALMSFKAKGDLVKVIVTKFKDNDELLRYVTNFHVERIIR